MRKYKALLQAFLQTYLKDYRKQNHLSQEAMSVFLHISPRSYYSLEHGEYGFSALSLIFFLLCLPSNDALGLLHEFDRLRMEEDTREENPD